MLVPFQKCSVARNYLIWSEKELVKVHFQIMVYRKFIGIFSGQTVPRVWNCFYRQTLGCQVLLLTPVNLDWFLELSRDFLYFLFIFFYFLPNLHTIHHLLTNCMQMSIIVCKWSKLLCKLLFPSSIWYFYDLLFLL